MSNPLYTVSEEEKYFFDLRGYLIIRNALSDADLAQCNATIDHYADQIQTRSIGNGGLSRGSTALKGQEGRRELTGMLGWPTPHREPFRKLLVHPVVVSRLNEFSGQGFRLDHGPLLISAHKGAEGHSLHGAGEPFGQSVAYHQQNGKIYCRGITVAWQLTDVNPGDGGFACVPGSHKSNFPMDLPKDVRTFERIPNYVCQPEADAGDVIIFTEALIHGTMPWNGDHERRALLYKFSPGHSSWSLDYYNADAYEGLTEQQKRILTPPCVGNRPDVVEITEEY